MNQASHFLFIIWKNNHLINQRDKKLDKSLFANNKFKFWTVWRVFGNMVLNDIHNIGHEWYNLFLLINLVKISPTTKSKLDHRTECHYECLARQKLRYSQMEKLLFQVADKPYDQFTTLFCL